MEREAVLATSPDVIDIDGSLVQERRRVLGLTQSALAARVLEVSGGRITISRGYLAEIERNRAPSSRQKRPRRHIALALADALAVPLSSLKADSLGEEK